MAEITPQELEELQSLRQKKERLVGGTTVVPQTPPVDVNTQPPSSPQALSSEEQDELELLRLKKRKQEVIQQGLFPQEEQDQSDVGSQLLMGVRESIAPFTVDREEYIENTPKTTEDMVARIGANILTDIGTSAAAGGIAGSIAMPVVGTAAGAIAGTLAGVGVGIYRALGYESMMAEVENREFNLSNAAVNVAVEVNPILKVAGKGVKVVAKHGLRAGTQAGLQYGQAKQYGADEKVAGIAAVVGGGVTGSVGLVSTHFTSKQLSNKALNQTAEALEDGGSSLDITKKAIKKFNSNAENEKFLAENVKLSKASQSEHFDELYSKNPEAMKKNITSKETDAVKTMINAMSNKAHPTTGKKISLDISEEVAVREAARLRFHADMEAVARMYVPKSKASGKELIEEAVKQSRSTGLSEKQAWSMYRQSKYIDDVIVEEVEAAGEKIGLREPISNNLFEEFGDLLYVAKATEHVSGLPMTKPINDMAKAQNTHSCFMHGVLHETNNVLKEADKVKLPRNKIGVYLEQDIGTVPEKFRPTVSKAAALFERIKSDTMAKGIDINTVDNYFTRISVPNEVALARVRNALDQYAVEEIVGATSGVPDELRRILRMSFGEKITKDNFKSALQAFESQAIKKTREGFEAMAAFARKGNMPELIRERDFARVVTTYANNVHKAAVIDPVIKQFQTLVPALEKLGFKRSANYWNKYIADMSGKVSSAKAIKIQQQVQKKAELIQSIEYGDITGIQKLDKNMRLYAGDFLSYGVDQFYPNFLGWRIDAPARNLTQPFLMTATELGGGSEVSRIFSLYGNKLAVKAWAKLLLNPKEFTKMRESLTKQGYFAGKFIGEGAKEYERSFRKSIKGLNLPVAIIDKINTIGMWLYSSSDMVNRYITRDMSRQLTKDIIAGDRAASLFVKRLPEGIKATVRESIRAKDFATTERLVTDYVLGKTQLNYGRHAMHQFGREHGRMVSTFTKWPSSVASDQYVGFKHTDSGGYGLMQKLLAPLAGLFALQQYRESSDLPPQAEVFLKPNLMDMSPLLSIKVGTPPALEAAYRTGRSVRSYTGSAWAAFNGDMNEAEDLYKHGTEQLGEGIGSMLPVGYGLVKGGKKTIMGLMGEEDE